MSTAPQRVTTAEIEAVREQLVVAGLSLASATCAQIAKLVNVTERRARTYKEKTRAGATPSEVKQEVTGDSWTITLPKTRINTVEELIESFKVDTQIWEIERFVVNAWDMGCMTPEGPAAKQLYQVKAWLKRRPGVSDARKEINILKAEAKGAARVYAPVKRAKTTTGHMLEVQIPDLHVGKLAWSPETGGDNYDVHIAEKLFEDALESLIAGTSGYSFERVLFVVGNDLMHSDTMAGTTTAGTPLDNDGRYHKTFLKTRKMITRAVERLRLIAPVDVVVVQGNHDALASWHLGDSLECTFASCPDVAVNNGPCTRKYYQWGQVMLMLVHGNKGKLSDYPLVMASEMPEMWGSTKFREAHTGDKHTTRCHEYHGVRVRIVPALCSADAWHSENFFTGNQRSAEAYVWSKDKGLVGTSIFTVPDEQ